jgi:hypothetical protein
MTTNNIGPRVPAPDDLRALGRLDDRDREFGQGLRAHLLRQAHDAMPASSIERTVPMTSAGATITTGTQPWRHGLRARLISIAAAVALALGGSAAYLLRVQAPTPVSAQTVLRHAAATLNLDGPDQVLHDVSMVHTASAPGISAGVSGLTDPDVVVNRWTQRDAHGMVLRDDILFTNPADVLLQHTVQNGQTLQLYNAQSRTTVIMTMTQAAPPQQQVIPDPFDPASLRQFVLDAQRGVGRGVHLLPQQTLDGAAVYVVQVVHTLPVDPRADAAKTTHQFTTTLYVRADTYAIRKLEIASDNAKGEFLSSSTAQIMQHEVIPLTDVPAQTFSLRAPSGTKVIRVPHAP